MIAYFRTSAPLQKTFLSRIQKWAPWEYIDETTGIMLTNNDLAIQDLNQIARSGGAVTEINAKTFEELRSKKKAPVKSEVWREEYSAQQLKDLAKNPSGKSASAKPAETDEKPTAENLNRGIVPEEFHPESK